jgi:pimeloyl-ACP methyl ester carboxylesterase
VVFEAGIAATSLSWSVVEPQVAEFATAVTYDRDGLGWSDFSGQPGDAASLARQLLEMLRSLPAKGPYLLVGHSFGGMLALLAASMEPEMVRALLLLDPLTPGEWRSPSPRQLTMLSGGVSLSLRGALLARLGVVRLSLDLLLLGARRLPKWISRASSGGGASVPDRMVGEIRKLPRKVWPVVAAHWSKPKSFRAMANHLRHLPESCGQVHDSLRPMNIPMVLISAGNTESGRLAAHQEICGLFPNSRHIIAHDSAHWVHLDAPELVTGAIRDLLKLPARPL